MSWSVWMATAIENRARQLKNAKRGGYAPTIAKDVNKHKVQKNKESSRRSPAICEWTKWRNGYLWRSGRKAKGRRSQSNYWNVWSSFKRCVSSIKLKHNHKRPCWNTVNVLAPWLGNLVIQQGSKIKNNSNISIFYFLLKKTKKIPVK